jgi:serine/threonine protein kinase
VILYELLTGHRPYRLRKRVFHEIVRVLCEEEPTLPSVAVCQVAEEPEDDSPNSPEVVGRRRQTTPGDLQQQLQGDLDSILLKSLRKESWQRYASASEFARDIDTGGEFG